MNRRVFVDGDSPVENAETVRIALGIFPGSLRKFELVFSRFQVADFNLLMPVINRGKSAILILGIPVIEGSGYVCFSGACRYFGNYAERVLGSCWMTDSCEKKRTYLFYA